jgi:GDPmannose 4,6-dehydratase
VRALITGVTGQDGSYLAELLLSKGYRVDGLVRWAADIHRPNLASLTESDRFTTHYGDLGDFPRVQHLIRLTQPDEIYNLGAQAHVRVSFDQPLLTAAVDGMAVVNVLEAARRLDKRVKVYQASTSELFGDSPAPQSEETPFRPRSPYAIAKLYAHRMAQMYREAYGMFVCCGILFNHESPRRGKHYVTRKITSAVADIVSGKRDTVHLGNLRAKRDWGYAPEYVEAMWAMMQNAPSDYVIATGEFHSVQDFARLAFARAGLDWEDHVRHDELYERPLEVPSLRGDASRAKRELGWESRTTFEELVNLMVDHDLGVNGEA